RASATLAWAQATLTMAFFLLFDPFALRDRACCALRNRRSARRRNRGLSIFRPSDSTAKCDRPRSIPTSPVVSGNDSAAASTTNEAKYRPAASLITVTLEGSDGRRRVHFTFTSPIWRTDQCPAPVHRAAEPPRLSPPRRRSAWRRIVFPCPATRDGPLHPRPEGRSTAD